MSFGGFKFGSSSTSAPNSAQPQTNTNVPSFSLTGPSPAATPATSQPFSFGAQPAQNTGTGAGAPPSTATGTGGGLFGSQQQQPAHGGLFGSGAAAGGTGTGTTASGSTSLFGAKPAASGGGLFGAAPASTNTQQTGGGGLFGAQQQQPQQQAASGGLFGSQTQPQQQSTGLQPSLFGSQQQQQASGGLFGQPQQQQQQQQAKPLQLAGSTNNANPQASGSSGGITKSTKFTDLSEQHQKAIEQLDAAFKQQRQLVFGTLDKQEDLGYAIRQVIQDVKSAEAECTALELGLAPLRRACEQLSTKVRSEEEDLQRLADIWGSYRPTDGRPSNLRAGALRDFRKQYFRKVVADSEERIPRYKKTISELRRAVDSLQSTSDVPSPQGQLSSSSVASAGSQADPRIAIAQTIQNHQNAIYTLAAQVEGLEVRWNDVRAFYSQMYKDKTGSIRDPLDVARERQGLPPVRT